MGATSVERRINWLHEVLYGADRQPAAYKDMSVVTFVRGYVIVMTNESDTKVNVQMLLHLEELMENPDLYGWGKVQAFHTTWLNQLEQNRCMWADVE